MNDHQPTTTTSTAGNRNREHYVGTEVIYCPVCKTKKRVMIGQDVCDFCQADDVMSEMYHS